MKQSIFLLGFLLLLLAALRITAQQSSKAPEIYTVVEEMPEFPGGTSKMAQFIAREIKLPSHIMRSGCKVFVRVVIDTLGKISEPIVLKGCTNCSECEKEAIRVMTIMPLWKPAMEHGKKVKAYYHIPISFTIR